MRTGHAEKVAKHRKITAMRNLQIREERIKTLKETS